MGSSASIQSPSSEEMAAPETKEAWDARLAALPANEDLYGWYENLQIMQAMAEKAKKSKIDPQQYFRVIETLTGGGDVNAVRARFGGNSERIRRLVLSNAKIRGWSEPSQRLEMQSLNLDRLFEAAERTLPLYMTMFARVCADITTLGSKCDFQPCTKLKSKARASAKVVIKYGSDCSRITDLVRGTMAFDTLDGLYQGVEQLINHPLFNGYSTCIVAFEDRYLNPLTGGYCDCQLLVNVAGHLCELQVNCKAMLEAKHGGGHAVYEVSRFVHEYVLFSAIKNDTVGLKMLLSCGLVANTDQIVDKNKFGATHFFALHGNGSASSASGGSGGGGQGQGQSEYVQTLVNAGADVFKLSKNGMLPATTAAIKRDWKITEQLLELMEAAVESATEDLKKKKLHDERIQTAMYLLVGILAEAPGEEQCGLEGPPSNLLASACRLVLRFDADSKVGGTGGTLWHYLTEKKMVQSVSILVAKKGTEFDALRQLFHSQPWSRGGMTAIDLAGSPGVDSPELCQALMTVDGVNSFVANKYRKDCGYRVLAAMDAGDLKFKNERNILTSPPEYRTAVFAWSEGDGIGTESAFELTFSACDYVANDGQNGQNADPTAAQRFLFPDLSDVKKRGNGSPCSVYNQNYLKKNQDFDMKLNDVVDGIVEALITRRVDGGLMLVADPLLESGWLILFLLLPKLAPRISGGLLRVMFVTPTPMTKPDETQDLTFPYKVLLAFMELRQQSGNCFKEESDDSMTTHNEAGKPYFLRRLHCPFEMKELANDLSSSVRPIWNVARTVVIRIAFVAREQSHDKSVVVSCAAQLDSNIFHAVGMDLEKNCSWLDSQFDSLYAKRIAVSHFVAAGMEEGLLGEARCCLAGFQSDYRDSKQNLEEISTPPTKENMFGNSGTKTWHTVAIGSAAKELMASVGVPETHDNFRLDENGKPWSEDDPAWIEWKQTNKNVDTIVYVVDPLDFREEEEDADGHGFGSAMFDHRVVIVRYDFFFDFFFTIYSLGLLLFFFFCS